jgi:hypothetical protein
MKRVLLRDRGQLKAREVVTTMLEQPPPGGGITYSEMRKRSRLLDNVEKSDGYVDFEDADYEVLRKILDTFPFGTAKRELRLILDDIANARSPEETVDLKIAR